MKKIIDLLESPTKDESQERQQVDDISKDAKLADAWERYHLVGAILRKEHQYYSQGFPKRVRDRIDKEPNILTPGNLGENAISDHADNDSDFGKIRRFGNRLIPAFAMAASIAAIAVIGLPFKTLFVKPAPMVADSVSVASVSEAGLSRWQTKQPQFEARLNEFLVEHGEFSTASNMNGLIAYAKFVSYDSAR